jgi:hypothetical protein
MSSRQMKRALAGDLSTLAKENEDDTSNEGNTTQQRRPAAFAFSNSDTSSSEAESSSEESETEEKPSSSSSSSSSQQQNNHVKKTKKNNTQQGKKQYDEVSFLEQAAEQARKEAVERAVEMEGKEEKLEQMKQHAMFSVNLRDFSTELELRRKFGSATVTNAQAQSANTDHRGRRGRYQPRGTKQHLSKKKTYLVKLDPNWPIPPNLNSGGMGMVLSDGTSQKYQNGCTYYTFQQSSTMAMINMEFQQRLQTHDPNQIQMHIRNYPFHPQGLWRMSKIYNATGQHDASAMLLRRCIYVYECGFHASFLKAAQQGLARMDYEGDGNDDHGSDKYEANQNFFHSLYDHAVIASRRGCRRSSLEIMKLIYQLDIRDPMGIMLQYDRYCLKSNEMKHLMDIFESSERNNHLRKLPNWLYSYTLATILSCNSGGSGGSGGKSSTNSRSSSGKDNKKGRNQTEEEKERINNTMVRAKRLLIRCILSYPEIALGLISSGKDHFISDALFTSCMQRPSSLSSSTTTTIAAAAAATAMDEDHMDPDLMEAIALSKGETMKNPVADNSSNYFREDRSISILKKICTSYIKQTKQLWSSTMIQNMLEEAMAMANDLHVNNDNMSCAMLMRRWSLIDSGVLMNYEGIDMTDENDGNVMHAIDQNNGGGGGPRMTGGSGTQEELDVNDPAFILMLQSLMPWNTLTEEGVQNALREAAETTGEPVNEEQ